MSLQLPDRPARYFIDEILLPSWDPSEAQGFDPQASLGDEAYLPVDTTINEVGSIYPSLIISYSNETPGGGGLGYDFQTSEGPGQDRNGTLVATARAQDRGDDYVGDSGTYSGQDAEDIVVTLVEHVEDICQQNADPVGTDFRGLSSQRGPEAPDDQSENPVVRLSNCQVIYYWERYPEP
ncbi:hypothetical protein ACFQL1_15905 [Halomicroarcula sp. GCM10025709]|uniref:hypothetical protein n=1 Tax=Haloarcula TaxID=2237 RepID=UPI0024C369A2|nr:hypothetical protein [Halomicroarcula sp. YJ-61-S]